MSENYELLRALVSPVVAITCRRGHETNGLIVNSALRASLSPEKLRLSIIVHKFNHSHDMIFGSGLFTAHTLLAHQIDLVVQLGCRSGRDTAKLADVPHHPGVRGTPVLDVCRSYFECEVVNAMDTGGSTVFLGAVRAAGHVEDGEIMTSGHVRGGIPPEVEAAYADDLARGQQFATDMADTMAPLVWRGLAG